MAKPHFAAQLVALQNGGAATVTVILHYMSECLELEGQHDEALPLLEGAVRISPDDPLGYKELAQYYQEIGRDPERAFALTDVMLKFSKKRKPFFFEQARQATLASELATRAVALANVGKFTEAKALMLEAKQWSPKEMAGMNAFLLTMQARILLAWDKPREALKTLQKAVNADPNGAEGKRAQRELEKWQAANAS